MARITGVTSFAFDKDTRELLDLLSNKTGKTKSNVMRQLIIEAADRLRKTPKAHVLLGD